MTPVQWGLLAVVALTILLPILSGRARRHWALLLIIGLAALVGWMYLREPATFSCLWHGLDCF